jgi:hypothetical protein
MKNFLKSSVLIAAVLIGLTQGARAATFGEGPLADYWNPVSPLSTYVYATSFVAPVSGDVTSLGTWLNTMTADPLTTLRFQILGSLSGDAANGPTLGSLLASTVPLGPFSGPTSFYSGAATSYTSLAAGSTYWFAINAIGGGGSGRYQVSSANDDMSDGGSFWYSNIPSGSSFDGQELLPEMAFSVTVNGDASVPDSGFTALMLLSGVLGLAALRKRVSK